MIFAVVLISLVLYLVVIGMLINSIKCEMDLSFVAQLAESEGEYQKHLNWKDEVQKKKKDLGSESDEIFTLYEMTKDISSVRNELEAFDIFKKRMFLHIKVKECEFFDAETSMQMRALRKEEEHFVFTLQWKKSRLGYLDFVGLDEEDKEKAIILGHQFALVLRRVRLNEEIERLAVTDSLTEVSTRRYALERFAEEIKRSKARNMKNSLLMIDVDYFKRMNDQYGHLVGDRILREIAQIIKASVREIDIVGRYGGEEFCVILPDTDKEGARFVAERIRAEAEKASILAYDTRVNVTLSIGTASFAEDGKSMEELIAKADWALYRAKKMGRNQVCAFGVYEE